MNHDDYGGATGGLLSHLKDKAAMIQQNFWWLC